MGRKFAELLGMNKYTGELKWAHDEESLDLCVEKANAKSGGQSKDLKALSGGERSYTTICLLLAFGEALETPVSCPAQPTLPSTLTTAGIHLIPGSLTFRLFVARSSNHICQFRVLDEFDVFLDPQVRKLTIRQLSTYHVHF
jgi:chromosome segregation ATPase